MVVGRLVYAVDGWGVGELYLAGRVVLAHELPCERLAAPGRMGKRRPVEAHVPVAGRALAGWDRGAGTVAADLLYEGWADTLDEDVPRSGVPVPRARFPKGTPTSPSVTVAERRARLRADFVTLHVGSPPTICLDVCEDVRDASGGSDDRDAGELATEIAARVRAHLSGRETSYADVPLDFSWCTPFQAAIADALGAVPWGEIVTYGELAALAGCHGASRAAGTFCARNRFALFLPCHRVVAAAGIGGYGASGVALKRRLLALEGVHL